MLTNYFKIAFRNILKYKGYSVINIMGLASGMAACLVILLFVADERSYDRSWPNGERIYRMALNRIYPDRQTGYAIIPPSYAGTVKKDFQEVEEAVRVSNFNTGGTTQVKWEERVFAEKYVLAADSAFFKVFQIQMLKGDPLTCLNQPGSLVMTASTAKRYFGSVEAAIGKTVYLLGNQPLPMNVTAVCSDLPENVHFKFDLLVTTKGVPFLEETNHISFAVCTYFLLRPGADWKALEAKFPGVVERYAAGEVQRNFGVDYPAYTKAGNGWQYFLQPLRDIHLRSQLEAELKPSGNMTLVTVFSIVAAFILIIACINFINLATARSAERAREVGIRKALGSERRQLTAQFLTEAVVVSLLSSALALGLMAFTLPFFNRIADKQISLSAFLSGWGAVALPAFALGVGLIAGLYPAGVLSNFRPVEVLKGKFTASSKGRTLRNGLVIFQFSISVALIISTLVVLRQLNFIFDKQLGFDKNHVVTLQNAFSLGQKTETYKQELEKIPGVESVGGTSEAPGGTNYFGVSFQMPGSSESVTGRGLITDERYLAAMKMEIQAGRGFSKEFNDSLSVVLNEKAALDLGFTDPEKSLGRRLTMPGSFFDPQEKDVIFTVVGVVRNFHFQSLHEPIVPLFMLYHRVSQGVDGLISFRVTPSQLQPALAAAEAKWKILVPDQPFHYTFLDTDLAALYQNEQRAKQLFVMFAGLAIFIACIGLLGLAAYLTRQRTKEIGIRKVLGASVSGITGLLAKDFLKLVAIAILIASPISYYLMQQWLQDFAYRVDIPWWMFLVAACTALSIAFLTVGFQSIRAALANPVRSLRSE
ncbi:MAG: ABC transporter permease [Saprospiraceae bacterium]|nr:ABC transporter permease [Saprospiraceae bacterium]